MPAFFPQLRVVDVGTDNLGVTSDGVLGSHELDQSVVDECAVGEEEGTAGTGLWEIEKLLLEADISMIIVMVAELVAEMSL